MAATHESPKISGEPPRNTLALGAGFGIGVLWITMGVFSLLSAARGYRNHRYDWGLTWGLIGLLITAAGAIAMVATWWHLTRVRDDN